MLAGLFLLLALMPALFAAIGPTSTSSSVVNRNLKGPARVTTGEGYFEYQAAIKAMKDPLPAGAEYPLGVPKGLDAGRTSNGIMQSGGMGNVRNSIWR